MLNGSRRAGAELALAIGGDWVLTGWQLGGEELERSQTGSRQESSFTQVLLSLFSFHVIWIVNFTVLDFMLDCRHVYF